MVLVVKDYEQYHTKPFLAVGMGAQGQLFRILNPITFVTYSKIPCSSAPGQLSLARVNRCLHLLGQLPQRSFFIFGNNISHSQSPTIHNTAFAELGLPYNYSRYETPPIDESISKIVQNSAFGGASITFPHKLQVQHLLDSLSAAAEAVGAVNKIIVEHTEFGRQLRGDNTDWLGILNCIHACGWKTCQGEATVVGAEGAARAAVFALQNLGYEQITMLNHTSSTAERMSRAFPKLKFRICSSLSEAKASDIIVACIPADDFKLADNPNSSFAECGGIVIEMSYRPPVSALMEAPSARAGWKVMCGLDVLEQQAYTEFQL